MFPQYGLSDEKSGDVAAQQALRGIALIFRDTLKKSRMFPSSLGGGIAYFFYGGESAAEALGGMPLAERICGVPQFCAAVCVFA